MESKIKIGARVLIRADKAGVHFGTLEEISESGRRVRLSNARRLWSWEGALSLSEVAGKGVDLPKSKITVPVEEIILPTAIETILISKQSNLPV